MWEPGLPAMQAPRCISYTAVMLSQASQLPHKPAPTFVSMVYPKSALVHELPGCIGLQHRPVIPQRHQHKQRLGNVIGLFQAIAQ